MRLSMKPMGCLVTLCSSLSACEGPQSALSPAGTDATRLAELFWWMSGAGLLIWLAVMGTALYALRHSGASQSRDTANAFLVLGGVVFPVLALCALLIFGLRLLPATLDLGPRSPLDIRVEGVRWWWRVRYEAADGPPFELANELHLPVGARVPLRLATADVIHALWVPSLAGKIDMIPGQENRMALEPKRTGHYRGTCAEYCGLSHARMGFDVVVTSERAFKAWLAHQRSPAQPARSPQARKGQEHFLSLGCGACHTIRGTQADGVVAPDLTHVGSRVSVGAASLPNTVAGFRAWLAHPERLKPGVHMPSFSMLSADNLQALAVYMESLR